MGLHGRVYSFAYAHVGALGGLRAPARAAILVLAALGVLAGLGASRLRTALARPRLRAATTALVCAALCLEYWTGPLALAAQTTTVPALYRFLQRSGPAIVLELPMPRADRLPGPDPIYQFWSIYHWDRLVNGYSGYLSRRVYPHDRRDEDVSGRQLDGAPPAIGRALHRRAPDLVQRRAGNVHTALLLKLIARPDIQGAGAFNDGDGEAALFVVRDSPVR